MAATRVLAIDYGTKRMGMALSDELGWTAQPLETYQRRSLNSDLAHIRNLVEEYAVRQVVLGLPIRTTGELGPEAHAVELFRQHLQAILSVPVVTWDERHTTHSAEAVLLEADMSRAKRKLVIDRIAAAILLQDYLASQDSGVSQAEPQDDDGDPEPHPFTG
ncbi:putative pre-16S rRNA nuclease [Nitrospira sp.]|nr:putative pre-16S rRNA nuclease [Nitrospira sp.]